MAAPSSSSPKFRVLSPRVVGPLAVYLIVGPDAASTATLELLPEALSSGDVVVRETREVGRLAVDHVGARPVLGLAGDLVKGGHQDRTLVSDVVLVPGSVDEPLPTFCVEQGRWHQRAGEPADRFVASHTVAPTTLR